MTFLLVLAVILLSVFLIAILIAKSRGTNIQGLLSIDVSKYTKLIDRVK